MGLGPTVALGVGAGVGTSVGVVVGVGVGVGVVGVGDRGAVGGFVGIAVGLGDAEGAVGEGRLGAAQPGSNTMTMTTAANLDAMVVTLLHTEYDQATARFRFEQEL